MTSERINATGFHQEQVPNIYMNNDSSVLAIFLPGMAYSNDNPLLYYPAQYAMSKKMNLLRIDYNYVGNDAFMQATGTARKAWLVADILSVMDVVLSRQIFERIILIGKSIGTLAMGEILTKYEKLKHADVVWLTPLLNQETLVEQMMKLKNRSLMIAGTADPMYVEKNAKKIIENTNTELLAIPNADHSMEIEGNVIESIQVMKKILESIKAFID